MKLNSKKGLIEGFLPSTGENYAAFKNDSIQAISYEGAGSDGARLDVVLFANTLTNKVHQRDEFNFISNAAFDAVADDSGQSVSGYTDVAADAWYADAVQQAAAAGAMNGVGGGKFAPDSNLSDAHTDSLQYGGKASGSGGAQIQRCSVRRMVY